MLVMVARMLRCSSEPTSKCGQQHPVPHATHPLVPASAPQGKAVLRKEPMSKDVKAGDAFSVNDAFTSKLYKVKIGMVTAQVRVGARLGLRAACLQAA